MMMMKNKKNKKKKSTTTNVQLGTLYDANKMLIEKTIAYLDEEALTEGRNLISNFILHTENKYYMLLCNERKDYTVFHINDSLSGSTEGAKILVDECIANRGHAKGINLTESKDAIEIWISIDGESCCYYFFPYDAAIIDC